MANTVIALKKSGTPSAIPVDLANGEIAINYADGKIFYKSAAGSIQEISGGGGGGNAFGTVNANGTLIVADTPGDVLTLIPGNGITIVGDAITDSITISSVADVSFPYNTANAAFDKANTAETTAVASYDQSNTNSTIITASFGKANDAQTIAIASFDKVNAVAIGANAYADTVGAGANAWVSANFTTLAAGIAAYDYANSVGIIAVAAYDKANSANLLAYNTGIGANAFTSATIAGANVAVGTGANSYADIVGTSANAYLLNVIAGANAAVGAGANTVGSAAFDKANTTETIAIAAYANSNTKLSISGGTITGDLAIVGNLAVSGNTSYISVQSYRVDDSLIYLAANNYSSDIVDIGFIANYVNSTGSNVHTGLYREHINKEYYLFYGYDQEPINNHIDPNGNNFTIAVLNADLKTSNLVLGGQNTIIWLNSAYNQANLAEDIAVAAFEKANTGGTGNTVNVLSQIFVANGSQTAFLLSNNITEQNNSIVSVDGLLQIPGLHYNISGSILNFTTQPLNKSNIEVRVFSTTSTIIGSTGPANNITVYLEDLYNHANIVGFAANSYTDSKLSLVNTNITNATVAANSYADVVGVAANSYADVVGVAANSYTDVVGVSANLYSDTIGVSANSYASAVGVAANSYASAVGVAANTVGTAAFNKANSALANTSGVSFNGNLSFPSGNITVGNTTTSYNITVNGIEVGYKNIPWSGGADKTSIYTLAKGDVGEFVSIGTSGSILVPNTTFAAGDIISIFNNTSATATINCSSVTAYIGGNNTSRATMNLATRGICSVFFYSSNVCVLTGNIT